MPVIAVGLITDYDKPKRSSAEAMRDSDRLQEPFSDPRWPWHAAAHLGRSGEGPETVLAPSQLSRYRDFSRNIGRYADENAQH